MDTFWFSLLVLLIILVCFNSTKSFTNGENVKQILQNSKFCVAEFMDKIKTYIGDSNIKFWCDLILVEL